MNLSPKPYRNRPRVIAEFRRTIGLIAALMLSTLLMVAGALPASANEPTPASKAADKYPHKSLALALPTDEVRADLQKVTIKSPTGESRSLAQVAPSCSGNWYNIAGEVRWWYDTSSRLTLMSEADWGGSVSCAGMAYISASTSLYFRNSNVRNGSTNFCGHAGNPTGNCGAVSSSGEWECGGIGNCNGTYYATIGFRVDLPAFYTWTSVPSRCTIELGGVSMFCVYDTAPLIVPYIN
ncbi:hypothetical protein [Nonomuraea zeae]|uniref:Uncharacterized protein n=1 Tax=Nonomuraea zeae TaxID=1642303 RepID=A0A5S4GJ58_9ACTN|nr:hypothetical protein [Nonomuraea zeae]TMR32996.1 hypothetical protein ETD85_21220 [Nonomuraea zeae]